MRVAGPLLAAILLAACATAPPAPCRTEYRSYPQPAWLAIPERYIKPLAVPDLPDELTNRDQAIDTLELESLIDQCQADRAELRRLNEQRGQGSD